MSATPYERQTNFTDVQAADPTSPLPAVAVDAELNRIKVTLDSLTQFLDLIQRDDGALANMSVGFDQLDPALFTGLSPAQTWNPAQNFVVNNTIFFDTGSQIGLYKCVVSHVSGVDFVDDLNLGYWELLADYTPPDILTTVPVSQGGTGATTPAGARAALGVAGAAVAATISGVWNFTLRPVFQSGIDVLSMLNVISTSPQVILDDTDGTATHRKVRFGYDNQIFRLAVLNDVSTLLAEPIRVTVDAAGATQFVFRIGATDTMVLNGTGLTISVPVVGTTDVMANQDLVAVRDILAGEDVDVGVDLRVGGDATIGGNVSGFRVTGDWRASVSDAEAGTSHGLIMTPNRTHAAITHYLENIWVKRVRVFEPITLSGSAIDFTSIPADATEIDIGFFGASLSGSDSLLVQISTGSTFQTTGYRSGSATGGAGTNSVAGFVIFTNNQSSEMDGGMSLRKVPGANTWISRHDLSDGSIRYPTGAGSKVLNGVLDGVRITTTGPNTFDAGSVFIRYR